MLEIVAIAVCAAMARIFYYRDFRGRLLFFGLCFTLVSDIFLVALEGVFSSYQSFGMTSFSIVQLLYFVYLNTYVETKESKKVIYIIRAIGIIVVEVTTIIVLKSKYDYLSFISMFYFANIVLNLATSLCLIKKNPLFAIALIFFVLCDVIVGLSMADGSYLALDSESILYKIIHPGFNIIWLFYLPSQVLITLTVLVERGKSASRDGIKKEANIFNNWNKL